MYIEYVFLDCLRVEANNVKIAYNNIIQSPKHHNQIKKLLEENQINFIYNDDNVNKTSLFD